jgi:cleavage stimulation factor subunit 2
LNDYEIMNRKLRVDFSNDGGEDDVRVLTTFYLFNELIKTQQPTQPNYSAPPPMPLNGVPIPPPIGLPLNGSTSTLPPLPQGIDLPPGLSCPDAISRTLNTLAPAQLLDVLAQMKTLVATDQSKATELLRQAPQLSYAIFQALLLMNLVSTDALASVVEQASSAPAPAPVMPTVPAPTPLQQQSQYPLPAIPGSGQGYQIPPPNIGTPPTHGMPYPPPPGQYQQRQQPAPAPVPAPVPDTDDLVKQVMSLPQEVIDQLPPAERAQILTLRATFQAQGHR